jgi:hypothetical protein
MIQLQHLRRRAQAIAADLPAEGWHAAPRTGKGVLLLHPDLPGVSLEAALDRGTTLLGQTFTAWLRTPEGAADVLGRSVLHGRDLAAAALADVRWLHGPEGRAANALVRLLGAAWAAGRNSAWMRIDLHRASAADGEMVLSNRRRRRLPGGAAGPLARATDDAGRVRHAIALVPIRPDGLSAHARLAHAEEARGLARACGLDAVTAEAVARRVLRDLVESAGR